MKINKEARVLGRRQHALIQSLELLLDGDSKQIATAQTLAAIEKLWVNVQYIHLKIHEEFEDPTTQGYDVAAYLRLKVKALRVNELISTIFNSQKGITILLGKLILPDMIINGC